MPDLREHAKLRGLVFRARRLVEGLYAGTHASPQRGAGIEFHDYRPYTPGDDPNAVDWKLWGRTDRHYIRRYQRYTDLHLYLMVDVSASMGFAGIGPRGRPLRGPEAVSKLALAKDLAAAIAFLTVQQADRVGLGVFDHRLRKHLPPASTWSHLQRLCDQLERTMPRPGLGRVGPCLAAAHRLLRRRGVVVLISDLLDEPAELFDGINRFRHDRSEVIVFQVLTPQELALERIAPGRCQLVDPESREQVATDVRAVADRYDELIRAHVEQVRRGCLGRGVEHNLVSTDQPVIETLRRYLAGRAR